MTVVVDYYIYFAMANKTLSLQIIYCDRFECEEATDQRPTKSVPISEIRELMRHQQIVSTELID